MSIRGGIKIYFWNIQTPDIIQVIYSKDIFQKYKLKVFTHLHTLLHKGTTQCMVSWPCHICNYLCSLSYTCRKSILYRSSKHLGELTTVEQMIHYHPFFNPNILVLVDFVWSADIGPTHNFPGRQLSSNVEVRLLLLEVYFLINFLQVTISVKIY